jgi:hypothetical protein
VIANYGYEDGSGFYYITIDTDRCLTCPSRGCQQACPQNVFVVEMDDYDDLVAFVREPARRRLRELCAACKTSGPPAGAPAASSSPEGAEAGSLPCRDACAAGALTHSW